MRDDDLIFGKLIQDPIVSVNEAIAAYDMVTIQGEVFFTDNKDSNPALDPDELPFHHDGHAEDFDAIRSLSRNEQMRTRKVTLHDWDYKKRGSVGENTPTESTSCVRPVDITSSLSRGLISPCITRTSETTPR